MERWLITYEYRLHRRHGEPGKCGAIFLDVERGTRSDVIRGHPIDWLEEQTQRWRDLEKRTDMPGEAMTNIRVLFAVGQRATTEE